jgi:hypothetical protein
MGCRGRPTHPTGLGQFKPTNSSEIAPKQPEFRLMTLTTMAMSVCNLSLILVAISPALGVAVNDGRACASDQPVFRESVKQVARIPVRQPDVFLRVAVFLKLKEGVSGKIVLPSVFYYKARFTETGVARVERKAGVESTIAAQRQFIYLPVGDRIERYLLFIRKATVKKSVVNGVGKQTTEFSDRVLFEVPAAEVSADKPIIIPAYDELAKREQPSELLKSLQAMYDVAMAEQTKEASTPVRKNPMPN